MFRRVTGQLNFRKNYHNWVDGYSSSDLDCCFYSHQPRNFERINFHIYCYHRFNTDQYGHVYCDCFNDDCSSSNTARSRRDTGLSSNDILDVRIQPARSERSDVIRALAVVRESRQSQTGTVDFGESDAPLTAAQYALLNSTLVTVPISASAVVPAYNLPGISNGVKFTGAILARIFLGNITMWNDPAIAALNPGVNLPAHAIVVVHRSDGSGTMFAFTNYLSDSSSQWKTQVGKSTLPPWLHGDWVQIQ